MLHWVSSGRTTLRLKLGCAKDLCYRHCFSHMFLMLSLNLSRIV